MNSFSSLILTILLLPLASSENRCRNNFLLLFENYYLEKDKIEIKIKLNEDIIYEGKVSKAIYSDQYNGLEYKLKKGEYVISIEVIELAFVKEFKFQIEQQGILFATLNHETTKLEELISKNIILAEPNIDFKFISDKSLKYYSSLDVIYLNR